MTLLWFLAGIFFAMACLILLLPWLRTIPGLSSLPVAPWQAGLVALATIAITVALYTVYGPAATVSQPRTATAAGSIGATSNPNRSMSSLIGAADALRTDSSISSDTAAMSAPQKANAGSMNAAIASLQARLAKGGGSADDWELLAKSYEFLGRPDDAGKARARHLPPLPPEQPQSPISSVTSPAPGAATSVSGEVSIAPALRARAAAGAVVFIVAKSVDSPGAPVAVMRTTVGNWPLKFTLDDSQSMLPGRNLSSLARVTVEARVSSSGQPLPASGDLQGASSVINAADRTPLKILIDRVVP